MAMEVIAMPEHRVGTREEWLEERVVLLDREKELTRRSDELARRRQALPWVPVEREYEFQSVDGPKGLADLFDRRSQLLIFHFMLGPHVDGWPEAGCVGCSWMADHVDPTVIHLNHRDVTVVAVSHAPLENLQAYRRRMGWSFPWVSCLGTEFNLDFSLFTEEQRRTGTGYNFGTPKRADMKITQDELHGLSAFALEGGTVYHTYSTYDRGTDVLHGTWQLLDRTPRGRGEDFTDWPRRHDEYEMSPDS
jgi:predicted dithiol-disulfide oxidoreductase (DUF899 family)